MTKSKTERYPKPTCNGKHPEPTCAGMHIPAKKGQRCGRCGKEGVCNWEDED